MKIRAGDRVYDELKDLVIAFVLKPGERLTELELAARFSVSRTPVREALSRLVQDGLLVADDSRGFAVRPLDAKECFDLYELRLVLEVQAARMACVRASDADLAALLDDVKQNKRVSPRTAVGKLVALDEAFHERIAALAGNSEVQRTLAAVNTRIRFMRWLDMEGRRNATQGEHAKIAPALATRNPRAAAQLLEAHIGRRMEDIVESIRHGIARIYVADHDRRSALM